MSSLDKMTYRSGGVKADLDLSRFKRNGNKAQFALDSLVMTDMIPFMPFNTGDLVQRTRAISASMAGTGWVCAGAPPSGRMLYNGLKMVDEVTGSPWARKGARKIATEKPLNYSNPMATPKWFETAKEKELDNWKKEVKDKLNER